MYMYINMHVQTYVFNYLHIYIYMHVCTYITSHHITSYHITFHYIQDHQGIIMHQAIMFEIFTPIQGVASTGSTRNPVETSQSWQRVTPS